jgi:hypothetical protein
MSERKKLIDILWTDGMNAEKLADAWGKTEAAAEFAPLPKGEYDAVIVQGELFESRNCKPGYKLTFEVSGGEYAGRRFWHDLFLTPAALPYTKRDLTKLGITGPGQLEQPLPARFRCRVKLALRKNDDGTEYNRVVCFEVVGVEEVERFAPPGEVAA